MQDRDSLTIGVLSITATILLVGIILVTVGGQDRAVAIGQTDRGGDYLVVTGQFTDSSELIYVTDAAARKMNVYSYDWNRGHLILWDSHDLRRALGRGAVPRPGR